MSGMLCYVYPVVCLLCMLCAVVWSCNEPKKQDGYTIIDVLMLLDVIVIIGMIVYVLI